VTSLATTMIPELHLTLEPLETNFGMSYDSCASIMSLGYGILWFIPVLTEENH
jgi:hypothetical protein